MRKRFSQGPGVTFRTKYDFLASEKFPQLVLLSFLPKTKKHFSP